PTDIYTPSLHDALPISHSTDESPRRAGTWKNRLKDGREIAVEFLSHTMSFAGRRAALVVAFDLTELTRTQASLAESTERLTILRSEEHTSELQSRFDLV